MGKTLKLAEFIESISYADLPEEVIACAKRCLFDYFGCAIFATQTNMGQIINAVCQEGGSGVSTILSDMKGSYEASFAALANGTCAHGFELDDVHLPSVSHPGAVVISAALALGEERGVDGKRFIEAVVAGYEAMARIDSTVGSAHVDHGFHPTASHGTFGAAAAAAKILNLNKEQIANAFGIAGSLASGIMQFSISGTMVKRIHAGKAAQQGVIIAKLAERGFTGPNDVLEGGYGYCTVFRGLLNKEEIDFDAIDRDLSVRYKILDTMIKPSPACGCLHAVVEGLVNIRQDADFRLSDVKEIRVLGHHNLAEMHNDYAPDTILGAQYSLPFTAAMSLVHDIENAGNYLDESILQDEEVLHTAKLIVPVFDEEIEQYFPEHFSAAVEVVMNDGKVYREVIIDPKGTAENPFSDHDVKRKYSKLVSSVLSKEAAEALAGNIERITSLSNIKDLFWGINQ